MSTVVNSVDLRELTQQLSCTVIERGAPGFAEELATFNSSLLHTPDVVVCAETVADVQTTVRYASARGIPLGVHSTGHGYTSFTEGIMISVRRFDTMTLNEAERTITVGAGIRWKQVLSHVAPHGLSPLAGSSTDVGVVGYSLGGGLSIMGRAFGYGVDQVHSLDLVTLDGEVHHVDADSQPELFWGLRGGGGNLGIVTQITVELVPVAEFYGGGVFFDGSQMEAILVAYGAWTQTIPDEMCTSLAMVWMPDVEAVPEPLRGRPIAHLRVCYLGEPAEGDRFLAPMRATAPALMDFVRMMPATDVDMVHGDPPEPIPFYARGTLLGEMTPEAAAALISIVGPDVQVPMLLWDLRHQEGAFARVPQCGSAAGGRDAAYNLQMVGLSLPGSADAVRLVVDTAVDVMRPWSTGHTILNVHGAVKDDADRKRAFDESTYERLVSLVRQFDPQGLLRHGHSIARSVVPTT